MPEKESYISNEHRESQSEQKEVRETQYTESQESQEQTETEISPELDEVREYIDQEI